MDCFYKIMVNYIKDTGAMAKLMAQEPIRKQKITCNLVFGRTANKSNGQIRINAIKSAME